MKLIYSCFLFLLPFTACAQMADGPYVLYSNTQAFIGRINLKDTVPVAVVDSFTDKSKVVLKVNIDRHPEWDFEVKLKSAIDIPVATAKKPAELLVLSDIEGAFEPFRNLLISNKVVDEKYNWTFGNGALVIDGDLFDRGKQVCQFLWLLYKLEDEAARAGGGVHVILGNHDIMNLSGDFRYVQPFYLNDAKLLGVGYASFYGANTELGQWLRSKNIIEKIGDLLFIHGGISQEINKLNLSVGRINEVARPYYDRPTEINGDTIKTLFSGTTSPFWYRGYFAKPNASVAQVDSTLKLYGVSKIIVGHDIIDHVAAFYNGKVIGVDVDEHTGKHEALLIENDKYYRVDDKGNKTQL
jgi:hypothetical protein